MTHAKTEDDWNILINEYSVCKKKLQSKREALRIVYADFEQCQVERDIYKNKICQLQQELDELKDLLGGYWRTKKQNGNLYFQEEDGDKKIKVLKQLLERVREENQALHNDLKSVKQLYVDSQNDNQLLREAIAKHESQQRASTAQNHSKARLIDQLEEAQNKIEDLQRELQALVDEKNELTQERDYFKEKSSRLNTELNYVLYNDEKRIVDVDALILENKYLKEVTKQYKEEKLLAVATSLRYKEALEQDKDKSRKMLAYLDLTSSTKDEGEKPGCSPSKQHSRLRLGSHNDTISELQRVAKSLTEMLSEKDIALKHQRNTNRILGTRVKELEKKLKTLEISGLWSCQGNGSGRNRKIELRLEEHMRQNQVESENGESTPPESLDAVLKSPTLSAFMEDEAGNNNNENSKVEEGMLLDIGLRKDGKVESVSEESPVPMTLVENEASCEKKEVTCAELEEDRIGYDSKSKAVDPSQAEGHGQPATMDSSG